MEQLFVSLSRSVLPKQTVEYYQKANWAFGRGGFHRYLPSQGLGDDPTNPGLFAQYWSVVKDFPNYWDELGNWISTKQQKLGVLQQKLLEKGRPDIANALNEDIQQIGNDLQTWWKVKGYLDSYWPEWAQQASSVSSYQLENTSIILNNVPGLSGVGLVPAIVLGVASLAAFSYVATEGLSLYQKYKSEQSILDNIKAGSLTVDAGATILKAANESGTALERAASSLGGSLGSTIGLGIVALVALKMMEVV